MSDPTYRVIQLRSDTDLEHDLDTFDCGDSKYNGWLAQSAGHAVRAGVSAVYLLVETQAATGRVVGYYAISPAQVVRAATPRGIQRGMPESVPSWRLGKLAVHVDLRTDRDAQWGRQLLRDALETIVGVAAIGGGKLIIVDADNSGLVAFYERNGFVSTGMVDNLTLYMKVSTARATLAP